MKNRNRFLAIGLCAICVSAFIPAQAQTNSTAASPATNTVTITTNAPTISGALGELYDAISTSGLTTATNYAVEPYLTYANSAPASDKVGGGLFLCYNVSKFVGTGLGVDYLGQFSLVSANVQIKVPTHPFASTGISWATNIAVCPFALAGIGKGLSGDSGGAIAVTDAGAYVGFGHLWGGQFNTGIAYGRWDNAGKYSGAREHFFLGWSKGF